MRKLILLILLYTTLGIAVGNVRVKRNCCSGCQPCNNNNCQSNSNNCQSNCNNCQSNCNNCQSNCNNNNYQSNCNNNNCQSNNCNNESEVEKVPVLVPFPPISQPVQQAVPSINNTNIYNHTSEITITNVVNLTNNISVPISVNTTNENHISIYPTNTVVEEHQVEPIVQPNQNCCIVFEPRVCDKNGYCYSKSHWECSDICSAKFEREETTPQPTTVTPPNITVPIPPAPPIYIPPPVPPPCQPNFGYIRWCAPTPTYPMPPPCSGAGFGNSPCAAQMPSNPMPLPCAGTGFGNSPCAVQMPSNPMPLPCAGTGFGNSPCTAQIQTPVPQPPPEFRQPMVYPIPIPLQYQQPQYRQPLYQQPQYQQQQYQQPQYQQVQYQQPYRVIYRQQAYQPPPAVQPVQQIGSSSPCHAVNEYPYVSCVQNFQDKMPGNYEVESNRK